VILGSFLGMVMGFASQQVLGRAIAGLFLLIARPFKVGDDVVIAGEDGWWTTSRRCSRGSSRPMALQC